MDWPPDPTVWPFARQSRQISVAPHRWHVQEVGEGPPLVLLHGAGGATHSWRGVIPLLAAQFRVLAVDLPGHGFTRSPSGARAGLEPMAQDLTTLLAKLDLRPLALIGHSAGGAVALRLSQLLATTPRVIGVNPALTPFDGVAGWLFPMLAKLMALNPLTPYLFTLGNPGARQAQKLIEGTGSKLDAEGYHLYARLVSDRAHVNGVLQMMARWDLNPLLADLPTIPAKTLFVTGTMDRAVAPRVSVDAAARMQNAQVVPLKDVGHLAHEEAPDLVVQAILPFLTE